ncbi:MAG: DUF5916 domain-containing protein [Gemmatimonadota bacterium]|nr:DUF5916 domain-containing protein [Gemmatimonadota bacterium]
MESEPDFPGSDIEIHVRVTDRPPEIDGKLDDAVWENATPYNDYFFQQEPLDRQPSSQKTEVRVLQDGKNLYFGIQCFEDDPSKIFATIKRRDGSFLSDDALELLIDTFQDKRNSYAFGTNPFGAKVDAIISDEGNHINKSWDCIWRCKTAINAQGWSVEMAIPFKSIKYKKGERVDWGLNITREIKHSKEVTYLAPIPRGLGHNGKFKGSLFGTLKNIKTPPRDLNLEVQPYLRMGREQIYETGYDKTSADAGINLRYHITPQLTMDLSYQTDFAQAEADEEVVNTTRFNINLKEKREFFLENAGLFAFGSTPSAGGTLVGVSSYSRDFLLFNSRSIGIVDEQRVPLVGGVKLAGRTNSYSLGMMNMQSKRTTLDNGNLEPAANFMVLRLKKDLFTNSNIGFMMLNKQSASDDYSRAVGSDAFIALSPELSLIGSLARDYSPDYNSNNWAGDLGIFLNKEWIDVALRYTHLDSLFNPEMSFINRENIRKTDCTVSLTKWINSGSLKSLSLITDVDYTTDHHNTMVYREHRTNLSLTLASEDYFYYGLHRRYDYLPGEDNILDRIIIDPGKYKGHHHHLQFRTYRGRRFSGSIHCRWGDNYGGRSKMLRIENNTKFTDNFNLELEYSYNDLNQRNGSLNSHVLSTRWVYSFTTEFLVKYYLQWNSVENRVSSNLLLDYIYSPRSHIYLVFNENRNTLDAALHRVYDRMLLLKFTYLWSV